MILQIIIAVIVVGFIIKFINDYTQGEARRGGAGPGEAGQGSFPVL